MPVTPFHLGPALLIGYPLRRRMDFATFLIANVITDVHAALVFFGILSGPLHGLLHNTYLGAGAVALVLAGVILLFYQHSPEIAQEVGSRPESVKAVVLASIAGTWLHTTLDAFTHRGMQPFYPLPRNPMYALTGDLGVAEGIIIHGLCTLAFLIFVVGFGISTLWKRWRATST